MFSSRVNREPVKVIKMNKLTEAEKVKLSAGLEVGRQEFKKKLLMEIAQARFNEWFYTREWVKPKVVSKSVAEENMGLFQKHLSSLIINLTDFEEYEREINKADGF